MFQKAFEELKLSGQLPSPSGVGLAVLHLTSQDDYSIDELTRTIQADPALSGRILRLANSALTGRLEPVRSVHEAAVRLGASSVRNVSLGFALLSGNREGRCDAFDYDRYWASSLACAAAAEAFAKLSGTLDSSQAFTCGLLSRIGMLALSCVHPDAYAVVLYDAKGKGMATLCAAESTAFDIDHAEVAAALMEDWRLPATFVEAVLAFERPAEEQEIEDVDVRALTMVLRVAWQAAELCLDEAGLSEQASQAGWASVAAGLEALGVPAVEHARMRASVFEAWESWGDLFDGLPIHRRSGADDAGRPASASTVGAPKGEPGDATTPVKVLVADDDPTMRRLLKRHLELEGYHVLTANDGHEALEVVLREGPSIVVTDWMMPGMTGIELCKALRRYEPGQSTYVLMLTGREEEERIVAAFDAGADDYVSKPFNPRVLLARVRAGRRVIEMQHRAEQERRARSALARDLGLKKRQLQHAVWTDFLTGLPNRRFAMERLEREWEAAVESGRPLSVIMVDVDNFKRVNDGHGHDVGDAVLRSIAGVLRAGTRRGDLVCRHGGEEFLVINLNSDIESATICGERLRLDVQASKIEHGSFREGMTISLGVSTLAPGMDADALVKAADQAVYEAKAMGRNKLVRAGDSGGEAISA